MRYFFLFFFIPTIVFSQQRFPVPLHLLSSQIHFEIRRQLVVDITEEFEILDLNVYEHLDGFYWIGTNAGLTFDSEGLYWLDGWDSAYILFNFIRVYTVYWFFDRREYATLRCNTSFRVWLDEDLNTFIQYERNRVIRDCSGGGNL